MQTAAKALVLSVVIGVMLVVGSSAAGAQFPGWSIQNENDYYLGRDPGQLPNDDDYSNGLRFSLHFPRGIWWGKWAKHRDCADAAAGEPCLRTTFAFGQNFYTPEEITSSEVLEHDRPYAAWCYLGIAGHVARKTELRTIELNIGTTGKPALGREVQTWWHRFAPNGPFPEPKGWAHQVKPVPGLIGVIGIWDHKFAFERKTSGARPFVWSEIDPYYRVSVGNVFSTAAGGAIVRVGYNIQRRWTEKIIETVPSGSGAQVVGADRNWEIHGFAAKEVRFVGWNALLQHDTYTARTLPAISRVVRDYELGGTIGRGRFAGGFRWVFRSPEIDGGRWINYAGPYFTVAPNRR